MVVDHHSMWGWEQPEGDVVFTWNDFTMAPKVSEWKRQGKKVVVFEHGWNSFFDYELNNHDFLADGYMCLGENARQSLIRHGLEPHRALVTGNPRFSTLRGDINTNPTPRILYTALHWVADRRAFNTNKLKLIKDTFPECEVDVKTNGNSKIDIPTGVKEWFSNIYANHDLFPSIARNLSMYDLILTPKESTFDFVALLLGKKVFRIAQAPEYQASGEPNTRNILEYTPVSHDLLDKDTQLLVDLKDELGGSLQLQEILDWVESL